MKDAMPASAIVMTAMFRMPLMTTGRARGTFIRTRVCKRVPPMPFAASSKAGSMLVMPVWVALTMGSRA